MKYNLCIMLRILNLLFYYYNTIYLIVLLFIKTFKAGLNNNSSYFCIRNC